MPFRAHRRPVLADVAQRKDDDAPTSSAASMSRLALLKEDELRAVEGAYGDGISAVQIVDVFTSRGIKFSEASFRKYVQQGLLPRSRRVGRKGKHRGSQGLYPVSAVRRINAIKKMMAEGQTLEEIKRSFLFFSNHIDQLEHGLVEVLDGFATELDDRTFEHRQRTQLQGELKALREQATALVRSVARFGSAVTARRTTGDDYGLAG